MFFFFRVLFYLTFVFVREQHQNDKIYCTNVTIFLLSLDKIQQQQQQQQKTTTIINKINIFSIDLSFRIDDLRRRTSMTNLCRSMQLIKEKLNIMERYRVKLVEHV